MAFIKTKSRNRLNVCSAICLAQSKTERNIKGFFRRHSDVVSFDFSFNFLKYLLLATHYVACSPFLASARSKEVKQFLLFSKFVGLILVALQRYHQAK